MSDEIKNCPECQRKSRPLDRGKVLAILNKEMFPADKIEVLKESINCGRLDVEEG